jgi:transcriptional regulator with XRE-family HTH domain
VQYFSLASNFAFCNIDGMSDRITPTLLAAKSGISQPYASQLLSGSRTPSRDLAIHIWRTTGVKLGEFTTATDADLEVIAKFAAPPFRRVGGAALLDGSAHAASDTAEPAGLSSGNGDKVSGEDAHAHEGTVAVSGVVA